MMCVIVKSLRIADVCRRAVSSSGESRTMCVQSPSRSFFSPHAGVHAYIVHTSSTAVASPEVIYPVSSNVGPSTQSDALLFFLSSSASFRLILCLALAQTLGKGAEDAHGQNGKPHNAHERKKKGDRKKGSVRERRRRRRAEGIAGPPERKVSMTTNGSRECSGTKTYYDGT